MNRNKNFLLIILVLVTIFCREIRTEQYCGGGQSRICVDSNLCSEIDGSSGEDSNGEVTSVKPDNGGNDSEGGFEFDFIGTRNAECGVDEVCCALANVLTEAPTDPKLNKCGIRNFDPIAPKITSDSEAEFGEFPWMVFLSTKTKPPRFIGGGSLIHPRVVLTVAHKLEKYGADAIIVRGGEYDINSRKEARRHVDKEVERIIIHENYRRRGLRNDIALLVLKGRMPIDDHINTICLPPKNFNFENNDCIVSGWGSKSEQGRSSKILKKVELPIISKKRCEELINAEKPGSNFRLHESFICAGGEAGRDTCTGDGGSPLVCEIPNLDDTQYHQAGIVSWGIGCGKENVPGGYVDVSQFTDWIQSKIDEI